MDAHLSLKQGSKPMRATHVRLTIVATWLLALLAGGLPARPAAAASGVIYVVPGGAGARSGADWANAQDLQPALLAAVSGSEIWVKAGTYAPATTASPGFYQGVAFQLKSGVALYGGFAGAETARAQRDFRANPTILSGDLLGNDSGAVHAGNPTRADNSRNVVRGGGSDATAILDGFTIRGGSGNGNYPYGGGLEITVGSPTLSNLVFHDNYAERGGALAIRGAASSPRITFVRFYRNFSFYGGGALYAGAGSTTISQAVFTGNGVPIAGDGTSGAAGGAVYVAGGDMLISHASFVGNVAGSGSAIYRSQGTPTLVNSIVWSNLGGQIVGNPPVSYSLVQGGYAGTGNIATDPHFIDAAGTDAIIGTLDDDLHLSIASPAINAGSDALIPVDWGDADGDGDTAEPLPLDLAGNQRRIGTVDMGAYEFQIGIIGPAPADATYGSAYSHTFSATGAPTLTYSLVAGSLPPGLTLSPQGVLAGTPTAAGAYDLTITVSGATGSATSALRVLVAKAPLTVTAERAFRPVGAAKAPLTVTYSGFVLGDDAGDLAGQPACSTTATAASPAGDYAITCAAGTLASANYAFSFVAGTLSVGRVQLYLPAIVR
jgi:hypothetical protein